MSKQVNQDFLNDDEVGLFPENLASTPAPQDSEAHMALDDMADGIESSAQKQYITFTIGKEEYGTPILTVQEIRGWMATTPLPNTPKFVKGVTNLRGNIVPVFDFRARFSGVLTEVTERHVVIMVEIDGRTVGLLVDAISDILAIDPADIQPPPTEALNIDIQYLDGLVASGDRMVALVNVDRLFDAQMVQIMTEQMTHLPKEKTA